MNLLMKLALNWIHSMTCGLNYGFSNLIVCHLIWIVFDIMAIKFSNWCDFLDLVNVTYILTMCLWLIQVFGGVFEFQLLFMKTQERRFARILQSVCFQYNLLAMNHIDYGCFWHILATFLAKIFI
jgi:hypothetical protein